jgi:hypothetical protein
VATILFMRRLVDNRFKDSAVSTLLHPIGFSFLFLVSIYAGSRRAIRAGVHWKKRLYGGESHVE